MIRGVVGRDGPPDLCHKSECIHANLVQCPRAFQFQFIGAGHAPGMLLLYYLSRL